MYLFSLLNFTKKCFPGDHVSFINRYTQINKVTAIQTKFLILKSKRLFKNGNSILEAQHLSRDGDIETRFLKDVADLVSSGTYHLRQTLFQIYTSHTKCFKSALTYLGRVRMFSFLLSS